MTRTTLGSRTKPVAPEEAERLRQEAVREPRGELGNLLQVVNGNLELIAQRTTDETTQHYLANARAAADQLTELTRALALEPDD